MRIGFVGLGHMGAPMAANLVRAGHEVTGFDLATPCPPGVTPAKSAAAAARGAAVVITMLPSGAILRSVAAEVIPAMASGSVLCDCSTVDVESARAVAAEAEAAGLAGLDAPVSGGVSGAAAATLTFMVGGSDAGFATVTPVLAAMGKKVVHCGGPGAGQAAKICNNLILGVTMIATCEAFALADKLGLDRQKMFDVVSTSSGQCWALTSYCPVPGPVPASPANNGYKPGFASALMVKDLTLAQDAAKASGAATPLGKHAQEIYKAFDAAGHGGVDFSGIIQHVRELAGK